MKIQVLALSALYLLTDSASARSYIERRACAKNNLMRTLERLQRESNFCVALLAPDPTVSVPSSIAATPLSTISSACNCIVATVTTMTTSSSSPTTSSTTSRTTSSTISGCSVSTITEIPPPVTVTETVEPSTCTVTTEPGTCPPVSTVTESCTTSSDPTSVPTSYLFGFEEPSKLWGGSVRLNTMTRDFGYMGYGEHEDPALAHSGSYYYRFEFPIRYDGPQYARFGTLKSVPAIPNTQYQLDVWFRQFRYGEIICNSDVEVSTEGNFNVDGSGTVTGGWFVARSLLQTGLQWTKTTFTFSSRGYSSLSLFFFVECDCPRADNNCGEMEVGFDDISLKVLSGP
ncbi:hypothetical protein ABW19_dt0209901 [Dactylella cylindrospora]|nr:hypothetical protein ABW19_dt0209901 [Dactylella cylindrospora]